MMGDAMVVPGKDDGYSDHECVQEGNLPSLDASWALG